MENTVNHKKESTVKDFLEVIFRRKWIILAIVLVSTLTVVGLSMREPALYESISTMLVQRGQASGVYSMAVRTLPWEEEIASQLELVKSQIVLKKAEEILPEHLPKDYEGKQSINPGGVETGVISTSNVLWVKYVSGNPRFCEAVVDAITSAYKEYYVLARTPPEMDDFFSEEMKTMKEEIEYWRERKEEAGKKWGIVDLERQREFTLQRIDQYEEELDELIREKNRLSGIIEKMAPVMNGSVEEIYAAYFDFISNDTKTSSLDDMFRKYTDYKLEELDMAVKYTDENKELSRKREEIKDLEKMIRKKMYSMVDIKKTKVEIFEKEEKLLRDLLVGINSQKEEYSEKEVEIDRINSSLKRLEDLYGELVDRQMDARISMASNPEWSITILSPATPARRQKTKDYVRMALGPFFSLLFAIGFAFFVDNLDHSIKNVAEAEEAFGFAVLASFPDTEAKK